jgi:hypothetical protein
MKNRGKANHNENKLFGTVILLFVISNTLVSCFKGERVEYYIVKIDSISAPDTVSMRDTLTIKLWAIIGYNTSYRFSLFEAKRTINQLDLTVWGKHLIDAISLQVVVDWRGKEYDIYPVYSPLLTIKIHQPDGSILQDTVYVKGIK